MAIMSVVQQGVLFLFCMGLTTSETFTWRDSCASIKSYFCKLFDFDVPKLLKLLFPSKKLSRPINFVMQFIELHRCCEFKVLCIGLI